MRIKAIFIGEDRSLGYRTGEQYELIVYRSWIKRIDGTGLCEYSSLQSFLKNWKITVN